MVSPWKYGNFPLHFSICLFHTFKQIQKLCYITKEYHEKYMDSWGIQLNLWLYLLQLPIADYN